MQASVLSWPVFPRPERLVGFIRRGREGGAGLREENGAQTHSQQRQGRWQASEENV